ncbi:MAG: flagellar basal-body MS-ring/collar protein FliF [Pseudomonadota bacterium]
MEASTNPPNGASDTSLSTQARGALARLDGFAEQPALRRALPAIAVLAVAIVTLIAWLFLAPSQRVEVQPGLPATEKARALEALAASGFDAQLDPSSGTLTVPSQDYHRARMLLATEGLPQGTTDGLQAIEGMPMGTSRQVEAARLRRMQELDLARTIAELRPVRAARVHLALPERTAFVRDAQPPRASVVLELAPGLALDPAQVRAVVSMVAAAVPDMPRGNVSVVDQIGTLLTTPEDDPFQEAANRQLAHQQRMERLYRERVMALLTPMVGTGNAAVEITLDMDFSRSEVTNEQFSPNTALRSEQSSQSQSGGSAASGIPGAISNTPPQEPDLVEEMGETAGASTANTTSSSTRNYEVSRRVETILPQAAQVTRIHAAVLLRDVPPPADAAGAEEDDEDSNSQETLLADVEALTRSAIGFDAERNDSVTVAMAPFVAVTPTLSGPAWYEAAWLPMLGSALAQIVVLAIVILGIVRPLLTRLLPVVGTNMISEAGFGEAIEVQRGESFSALRQRVETATPTVEELDGSLSYEEKIDVVRQLAGDETNRIAGVFKGMLKPKDEVPR